MTKTTKTFSHKFITHCVIAMMTVLTTISDSDAAAVVSRNSRARRMPTVTTSTAPAVSTPTPVAAPEPTPVVEETPEVIIEDKSEQFGTLLGDTGGADITVDDSATNLSEMIQRQRAALDASDAISTSTATAQKTAQTGLNSCDTTLRTCIAEKCGKDFTKCSGDTDMTWGDKMDSCRRSTNCTGHEYQLFSTEIKADRDANAELAGYNAIIECGNSYNTCIVEKCGPTFSKCLGKKAGDKAIEDCKKIAQRCTQQDNGLAARMMNVFATLRQSAEVQVAADEKRLYELRDKMRSQCEMLGALFDERTLDCVYTVNFFAGTSSTPYASKKAYAGSSFDCDQNWFGIDVTTFKENAYRYAREQSSATSALLGSGIGTATGAITSGAIDRAIDRQKAKNALKKAKDEHDSNHTKSNDSETNEPESDTADTTDDTDSESTKPADNADSDSETNEPESDTADTTDDTDSEGTEPADNADSGSE